MKESMSCGNLLLKKALLKLEYVAMSVHVLFSPLSGVLINAYFSPPIT